MKFIVRKTSNQCAVKFVRNLSGRHANDAANDQDATPFDTKWEAELKAKEFGMLERDFHVEQVLADGQNPQPK